MLQMAYSILFPRETSSQYVFLQKTVPHTNTDACQVSKCDKQSYLPLFKCCHYKFSNNVRT